MPTTFPYGLHGDSRQIMFDYMEFQVFGPGEIVDFYSTSSPSCMLQEQDQDLAAFFPELIESDWQEHRYSQCR